MGDNDQPAHPKESGGGTESSHPPHSADVQQNPETPAAVREPELPNQEPVMSSGSEVGAEGKAAAVDQEQQHSVSVAERKMVAFEESAAEPNPAAKGGGVSMQSCIESSVRIVKGEIHNVLSLMRLNRRYSSGARFHREIPATAESPLVRGLKHLHETLASFSDIQDMDTLAWLRPFLDVIESPETSGPITGGALSSLSKFLLYGFIHPGSPRAAESVCRICRVVTRCRFERTDHSGDEVVLVRILQVLHDCLRCPAGELLTDQNVWDMVQSCYDIGRQPRLSELLQRTAEHMLTQVVLTIFSRFSKLQSLGMLAQDTQLTRPLRNSLSLEPEDQGTMLEATESAAGEQAPPYGLPCMLKLLEFLCRLTNLGDNADAPEGEVRRMLGLSLVNVVLETGGKQLSACNPLVGVIQHDLSRNLLQNSRTHNLQILSLTLRVVFNMFNSVREHMKVQLEVFFNSIHLAESSQQEAREMALESLVEFCREPQLMVDIYTNYDCDVQCTNLFEDMCKFLSKNTFPLSGSLNALNLLSLEGLLAIVRSLADSCGNDQAAKLDHQESRNEDELSDEAAPNSVEQLRLAKQRKKRLAMGAEQFNRKPGKGLEFCQSLGLLPEVLEPVSIGTFLRTCPGLDKTAIGLYLGEPDELNLKVLTEFTNSFDFTAMELGDALRAYLATFRLPGESQKIARIVETFAARYYEMEPGPLASADTAYILSYAIIMLNTDLHNAQVKKKMTKDDFLRMNRGINDNKDLPPEFLAAIYENILNNEIKMSEDLSAAAAASGGQGSNEPRWDDLLTSMHHKYRNRFAATLGMNSVHARDMFLVAWDGIISALSVVFETTEDDKVLRKTIEGFHNFSKICSFHHLHDEFNKLIATLSKSLYKFAEAADANRAPDEDANGIFVRDAKVKIAAQEMFAIAFNHADGLREGWSCLLDFVARLHRLKALPASLMETDDFVDLEGRPLSSAADGDRFAHRPHPVPNAAGGVSSFFRSISYLWGAAQAPRSQEAAQRSASCLVEPGNEELAAWVGSLRLEELLGNTKFLSNDSVSHLTSALVLASSKLLGPDAAEPGAGDGGGGAEGGQLAAGEHFGEAKTVESALLSLELLTNTVVANAARAAVLWGCVHRHMKRLLDGVQEPNLVGQRAVVNQLRLCLRLMGSATPEEQRITTDLMEALRAITLLPAPVFQSLADRISVGLLTMVRANAAHIRQREDWETVASLLQQFAGMAPAASKPALEAMSYILREDGQASVSALNFDFLQQALLAFVDAVLSPGTAKQHAAAAMLNPNPTAAEIRRWQQHTAAHVMSLMYALFVRLRCWQGAVRDDSSPPAVYRVGGVVTGGYHLAPFPQLAPLPPAQQQQQQQQQQAAAQSGSGAAGEQAQAQGGHGQAVGEGSGAGPGEGGGGGGIWRGDLVQVEDGGDSFGLGDSEGEVQGWCNLWMLSLKNFCRIAHDERYALVSGPAMECLERALLCAEVSVPYAAAWRDCYDQILFPIVSSKFKAASAAGQLPAEALCLTTLLLLCKSFRNNLHLIIHLPELHMLWLKLLGLLEAFKQRILAASRDPISESIVLTLKEMLQALHSDPLFQRVQQASGQNMWALTSTVIGAFSPNLMPQLEPRNDVRPLPAHAPPLAPAAAPAPADSNATTPAPAPAPQQPEATPPPTDTATPPTDPPPAAVATPDAAPASEDSPPPAAATPAAGEATGQA